ncbi:hypothetical protein FRB90_012706 [Tulasnella sp. 427]|nr:hypothetical protein FRB90_012706 [Tulasnella sp. 427]
MRLRITTHPPLPPLKVWFGIDDENVAGYSVQDLKKGLSELFALRDFEPEHLLLELDDFELLDESLCSQVLQAGDLIHVKSKPSESVQKKRKPTITTSDILTESRPTKRPRMIPAPPVQQLESSSSSSSDDTSEEDSDSDSESSSSSDTSSSSSSSSSSESSSDSSTSTSSSDSSTSSSSSDSPAVQSSKSKATLSTLLSSTKTRVTPLPRHSVPPGQGKPSTQDRNRRRRIARKHRLSGSPQKAANPPEASKVDQTAATTSFEFTALSPAPVIQAVPVQMHQEPLMMMSLKNSNKRKGYKERLNGSSGPTKLVFSSNDTLSHPHIVPAENTSRPSAKSKVLHVTPPSELPALPSNIFVTSVDVEADIWGSKKNGNKNAKKNLNNDTASSWVVSHSTKSTTEPYYQDDVVLDYGEPEGVDLQRHPSSLNPPQIDWNLIESAFDQFPALSPDILLPGAVVAWQGLGIDPSTLTPTILLHVGEIVSVSQGVVEVKPLHRPNSAKTIGFGLRVDHGQDLEDDDFAEVQVETFAMDDIKDWKLVQDSGAKL